MQEKMNKSFDDYHLQKMITKILSIFSFFLLILVLFIMIEIPPAARYEISIYNAYPWYLWLFIITSIFLGQVIILRNVFFKSADKTDKLWLLGFTVIITSVVIILFMPYARGYLTNGRADHLTHIGIVANIIKAGHIENNNFYPNMHILTSSVTSVCGYDVISVINLIPRLFFFISPLALYLFFRTTIKKNYERCFALLLATSFVLFASLCNYSAPCPQSFLLLPLILYIYFKRGIQKNHLIFSILFILLVISYVTYHPLNSLLLILVFLVIGIILYLSSKYTIIYDIEGSKRIIQSTSIPAILLPLIIWLAWYLSFTSIGYKLKHIFTSLISEGESSSFFADKTAILSNFHPKIEDLVRYVLYTYGPFLIIGTMSLFSLIYILIKFYRNKELFKLRFSFLFSGISFLLLGVLATGSIFLDFIVGWNRFVRWSVFFSFLLIPQALYNIGSNYGNRKNLSIFKRKSIKIIIISIILIMILFLSVFTFYRSPLRNEAGFHVTNMEWEGMKWFFNYRNKNYLIDEIKISQTRFYDAIGIRDEKTNIRHFSINVNPPDHFSYENTSLLGNYYNESRYLIISLLGRIYYPNIYPDYFEFWRFNDDDFDKLDDDITVTKIYTNDNNEVYSINNF